MNHDCTKSRSEFVATVDEPYHYTEIGLPDVYLVGIRYLKCECGGTAPEIPSLNQLLQLIAGDLAAKPTALSGEEIRFLRKRLGKKQADFAKQIGIEPETLSRYETGRLPASKPNDKLIRLYYAVSSGDHILLSRLKGAMEELLAELGPPRKLVATVQDNQWRAEAKAA